MARAGCQEPAARTVRVGGEQARGPQHEVKPAASTYTQSEGRAAHFTAKATLVARDTKRDASLGGVWGAARVQGSTRNTRGPSALPLSRHGGSYKPRATSSAAQRESEGVVVLAMAASNNAVGGKDLCFGHARGEGTREGMAAKSEPNHPGAHRCVVQAQRPQRELGADAKQQDATRRGGIQRARCDDRACPHRQDQRQAVHAPLGRPSVSRVREIRTHGLKGGLALSPKNSRSST